MYHFKHVPQSSLVGRCCQVAAAPKNRAKDKEKAEKVTPKTLKDLAEEEMENMLKTAANARSNHIKLTNVQYGAQLSAELLAFAESVEELFKRMQGSLKDEKALSSLVAEAKTKEDLGSKLKAWKSCVNGC